MPLHQHHQNLDQEDLSFWRELAQRTGGPILELGCGDGRIALPLAADGHTVLGLDLDPAALRRLVRNRPAGPGRLWVVQADAAHFCAAFQFRLVVFPCNTLSTLGAVARAGVFTSVRRHLHAEGRFVAARPNPDRLRSLARTPEPEIEGSFEHPETGNPVQVTSEWARSAAGVTVFWHYDHLHPDGRVERESASSFHDLTDLEGYAAGLAAAGLDLERVMGDYDGTAYGPDAPYLILIARLAAG